jgi:hypothetical protein
LQSDGLYAKALEEHGATVVAAALEVPTEAFEDAPTRL